MTADRRGDACDSRGAIERPSSAASQAQSRGRLGIQVTALSEELRRFFGAPRDAGVLISRIAADGPAANAGARVGDVLVMIGRARVRNADDVVAALSGKARAERVPLVVIRDHRGMVFTAELDGDRPQRQPRSDDGFPGEHEPSAEPPAPAFRGRIWTKRWQWQWSWPGEPTPQSRKPADRRSKNKRGRI